MKTLAFALALGAVSVASAVTWTGLDDTHKLGGRKVSDGYLRDKVVLISRDAKQAPRMEEIWTSFKTKPFVLLGIYTEAAPNVTYAMYSDVEMGVPEAAAPLCVIDETGHVYYHGADERKATESLVMALTDTASPKTLEQAKRFLDYEIENLPAHAMLRFVDFEKKFPASAKQDYAIIKKELAAVADVKKAVELLKIARTVKDPPVVNPKKAKMVRDKLAAKAKSTVSKYKSLKDSAVDERVKQEVKNALADLQWALSTL